MATKAKTTANEITFEIKVKKNDYEQPTEIRPEVVQMVVDAMIENRCDNDFRDFIWIRKKRPYQCITLDTHFLSPDVERRPNIRIRTCEMKKAFEIIQDAGYYIHVEIDAACAGNETYHITKKPYYGIYKCERVEFSTFID